jgi:hypothetical protein
MTAQTTTDDLCCTVHDTLCAQRWEVVLPLLDELIRRSDDYVGLRFPGYYAGAPDYIVARITTVNVAAQHNSKTAWEQIEGLTDGRPASEQVEQLVLKLRSYGYPCRVEGDSLRIASRRGRGWGVETIPADLASVKHWVFRRTY